MTTQASWLGAIPTFVGALIGSPAGSRCRASWRSRLSPSARPAWRWPRRASAAALVAILFVPVASLAIGPNDQIIPDTTLNNAGVFSLTATGVLSGGLNAMNRPTPPVGTGTVIGAAVSKDGKTGFVSILTANHVARAGVTTLSLGQGFGATPYTLAFTTGPFRTYTAPGAPGTPPRTEDVSVIRGTIALNNANMASFTRLTNNLPTITNPANNPLFRATATNPVSFTQIGYGNQGVYNNNIPGSGGLAGYQGTGTLGERLFQNNQAIAYVEPGLFPGGQYYEPLTMIHTLAPTNNTGLGGAGLPGDSGGPLYTQPPANPLSIGVTRGGGHFDIPVSYTNSLSAIFVAGDPTLFIPSIQFAVPIDRGLYNWLQPLITHPQSIPEPDSLVLLGLGCLALGGWRGWRRGVASRLRPGRAGTGESLTRRKTRNAVASAVVLLWLFDATAVSRGGIITGVATSSPFQLPEGVPQIDKVIESFKSRDYDRCLELLKAAAASHPEWPPGRIMFAKLCLLMDQPAPARDALEQAVVEEPELPETYLLFGRLALHDDRPTDAQLQFDKAMALAVSGSWSEPMRKRFQVEAHSGLASVAERRKDWATATVVLTSWLRLEPRSGPARRRLAEALFHRGQRPSARAELEQAVQDDPSLEPAGILLGRLFTEEGDLAHAEESMEAAIRLAPEDPRARLAYASWLWDRDRPGPARIQAEAAARGKPDSAEARCLVGLIAWQSKDYPTAERIFRDLHAEDPGNFAVSNLWALSLAEQPSDAHRGRAWQVAQINAQLYPGSAEALTTLGWVAHRLGQIDQAEQSLRAALAGGKASSETAYYLARVLADRRRTGEARQWLKLSLDTPGRFAFRNEAQVWLDQLAKIPGPGTREALPD